MGFSDMAEKHLLNIEGLRVVFDTEDGPMAAVNDVSLHADPGETVVIVGESGSGKSVSCLATMQLIPNPPGRIDSGRIFFRTKKRKELEITRMSQSQMRRLRGNDIAMIFQEPMTSLNPVFTVGNQIMEVIRLHQRKCRREAFELSVQMMDKLGIPEPRERMSNYPYQMSGGMRQRVMIAMALACRPALLIADEPTTALDVTIQAQILDLMKELQRDSDMALLFITHNLGVAAEIADRIVIMYAGQVVEQGTADEIFNRPRMPYTRGLLSSVPRFDEHRSQDERLEGIPGTVPLPSEMPPGCTFHPRCPFYKPGLCDQEIPELEVDETGHSVRCLRWREIMAAEEAAV